MKTVVVGLGVQGKKRRKFISPNSIVSVDPYVAEADYRFIEDISLNIYDTVLICVPDNLKLKIIKYCLENKKNVLVEKPLILNSKKKIEKLKNLADKNKVILYTAYNHRFEPHFKRLKKLLDSKKLGKIYSCRLFYGNGTARLVRNSWRDKKSGVILDIGSHLLDTCLFWFGKKTGNFKLRTFHKFENKSPDHATIYSDNKKLYIELEMSYCMWQNHFTCDVIGEKGSAHITSLCKWGPSTFIYRKRILPSGKPPEFKKTLKCSDPTWLEEYKYFQKLIRFKKKTDLTNDLWLQKQLSNIAKR